jgi:hypothetical protein
MNLYGEPRGPPRIHKVLNNRDQQFGAIYYLTPGLDFRKEAASS